MSDKKYCPRVVPRCPCCLSLAMPNVDVARTTEEKDEQISVSETPLFSLGDLILDTRSGECGLRGVLGELGEGSITARFISVLQRTYATLLTRCHISNFMIKKCVGGVFVDRPAVERGGCNTRRVP